MYSLPLQINLSLLVNTSVIIMSIVFFFFSLNLTGLTIHSGGSCRIRTYGTFSDSTVFKTVAINHSAKLPCLKQRMESNHLSSAYEANEIPFLYSANSIGATGRNRTLNLLITNQELCLLSYCSFLTFYKL